MAANANPYAQPQPQQPPALHHPSLTQSPGFPLPHFPISLADIHSKAHTMSTSSLALLLPGSSPGSYQYHHHPTPLAQQLERQSAFLVEAINARNFTAAVTEHIAPGFRAAIGDFNTTQDFAGTTSMMSEHARRAAPGSRVRVVNSSADVDERAGAATVFQLLDVLGYAESMRTQAICVLKWSRRGERWLLEAVYGMSGLGSSDG